MRYVLLLLSLCLVAPAYAGNTLGTNTVPEVVQENLATLVQSYVVSECLPTLPSSSLTLAPLACTAMVRTAQTPPRLVPVVQVATALGPLNAGDGLYWIAVHTNTSTAVPGWVRTSGGVNRTGSHYLWLRSPTPPVIPPQMLLIARVTVATVITAIQDRRIPASYVRAGVYDVTDPLYGARHDGVTNDAPALQAAHDAMPDAGGMLYLPQGIYLMEAPLTLSKGMTVQGEGITGDVICCSDTAISGTALKFPSTTSDDLIITASNGFALKDFVIFHPYATDPTAGTSIHVVNSTFNNNFFTMSNVLLSNVWTGIAVDRGSNCTLDNIRIFNPRSHGISLHNVPNADSGTCHVSNAMVVNMGNVVDVNDFTPTPSSFGFRIEGGDFWCFHCNVIGPVSTALAIDATALSVSTGNAFIVGGSFEAYITNGILMSRASGTKTYRNIQIIGNEIGSNPGQGSSSINIASGGFTQVTITGNVLLGDDTLLKLQGGVDIEVSGNTLVDAAIGLNAAAGVTASMGQNLVRGVPVPFAGGESVLYTFPTPVTLTTLPANAADGSAFACTNCGTAGAACVALFKGGTAACQ